jgi:signal transduction histidine kinase
VEETPADRRLAALIDSGLALASELDLDTLLQRIADLALEVIGAKYGAVGVLGEEGDLVKFVHSGIGAETVKQIGALPTGKGVLGALIEEGKPLRLRDISEHPRSYGFPRHHPVMRTFLGVPIVVRGRVFGRLYLTEKQGPEEFSKDDERLGLVFAAQAGVAIENARLTEALQDLAILEERERISKELHDGVIQSIYSAGLSLQGSIGLLKHDPDLAKTRIDQVIGELDNVVRDVRGYIFELRPKIIEEGGFREAIQELVRDLEINTLANADVEIEEEACDALGAGAQAQIVQVVREVFSNIARHANASEVWVRFRKISSNQASLVIEDDGVGFDPGSVSIGDGLANIRDRAARLGGALTITARQPKGTRHELRVPVGPKENSDE